MKKITKTDAINFFRLKYKICTLNATLSTRNKSKNVYWATPNYQLFIKDWYLILNDDLKRELHLLYIPANTFKPEQLRRRDSERAHIEITYDDLTFPDEKSKIKFEDFYKETMKY